MESRNGVSGSLAEKITSRKGSMLTRIAAHLQRFFRRGIAGSQPLFFPLAVNRLEMTGGVLGDACWLTRWQCGW